MGKASWISDGPDRLELEAVLASGLHDGLHEDDIEDMQMQRVAGTAVRVAQHAPQNVEIRPVVVRQLPPRFQNEVPQTEERVRARDWFANYYPKLKPEDLADFYRTKYLRSEAPVLGGTPEIFETYKRMIAERIKGESLADAPAASELISPVMAQPRLSIVATDLRSPLMAVEVPVRGRALPRTNIMAILSGFAIFLGGLLGMEMASSGELSKLLVAKASATEIVSILPAFITQ
jgi:hypothetical protein